MTEMEVVAETIAAATAQQPKSFDHIVFVSFQFRFLMIFFDNISLLS